MARQKGPGWPCGVSDDAVRSVPVDTTRSPSPAGPSSSRERVPSWLCARTGGGRTSSALSLNIRLIFAIQIVLLLVVAGCAQISTPNGSPAGIVVGDALIIGTTAGELVALDTETGETLRSFELRGEVEDRAIYGTPAVAGERVFVGGYDGGLYALTTGLELKWHETIGEGEPIVGSPVVVGETVLVGSSDGYMYAFDYDFDSDEGSERWRFPTGGKVWATPTVMDGVVYFGSMDHNVYAVRLEDGTKVWESPTDGSVVAKVLVIRDIVYAGSFDGNLYALDAKTGEELLRFEDAKNWYWADAVATADTIYAPSLDGNLYALSLDTLELQWPPLETDGPLIGSPAIVGDWIAVPSKDGWVWLARLKSGGGRRECNIESKVYSLEADGEVVYLAASDKSIRALKIDTNGDPDEEWARFTDRDGPETGDRNRPC